MTDDNECPNCHRLRPLSTRYKIFGASNIINTISSIGLGIYIQSNNLMGYLLIIPIVISTITAILAVEPIWRQKEN